MAQRQNGIIPHEFPGSGFNGRQQTLHPNQVLRSDNRPTMAERQDGIIPGSIIAADPGGTNEPSTAPFQQTVPVQHTPPAASPTLPFARNLHRVVNDIKNDELIRWSERGDSLVVLDKDRLAENLFPVFRHKNYSSFAKQLTAHGFRKRVDPSENSKNVSERKEKSQSEYYNPHFKRGHPNLLGLMKRKIYGHPKMHPSWERHKMHISHIIETEGPRTAHPPLASPTSLPRSEFPNSHHLRAEELLRNAIKDGKRQSDLASLQAFPKVRNLELRALKLPIFSRRSNRKAAVAYMVGEHVQAPCTRCDATYGPFSKCVRVVGFLSESCSNCHYNGRGTLCSLRCN